MSDAFCDYEIGDGVFCDRPAPHCVGGSEYFCHRHAPDLEVTLDGEPATITGWRKDFPHVVRLRDGMSVPFAHETIERVLARGGHFKS